MKKMKKKWFLTLISILSVSVALSAIMFSFPVWDRNNDFELKLAKNNRLSSQVFPVWGLDISHHNVKIDWFKLIVTKPNFVFIKSTEGSTLKDEQYDSNWVYLKRHRILRGAYHFFSYKSTGELQAQYYISNVKLSKGDLPPVLDVEYSKKMPSAKKVTKQIIKWLTLVEKHYNVKPIIYCSWRYYKKYLKGKIGTDYPLWICDYRGVPDSSTNWVFWQHTDKFKVPGINISFDRNVYRYDSLRLKKLLIN
ncbi:MAG: GH25 family lysozyme [Bacteroidota bacterium]